MFRVSAANVQRTPSSSTTPGTTGAGTRSGNRRCRVGRGGLVGRDADSAVAAALPRRRPADLGHQRRALHPPEATRTRGSRWCRRIRTVARRGWSHLAGLDGLQPRGDLELLPYTAGARRVRRRRRRPAIRSTTARALFGAAGLDMKYGLTSNLTVDATVNPGFRSGRGGSGRRQPHARSRRSSRRSAPFFLEGSQIFNNFGRGGANDFWGFNNSEPQIFYSRRIGRAPQLQRRRRIRRLPDGHHDSRRRETHRQDAAAAGASGCSRRSPSDGDRRRTQTAVFGGRGRRRAADQLRGGAHAARYRHARRRWASWRPPSIVDSRRQRVEATARRAAHTSSGPTRYLFLDARARLGDQRNGRRQPGHRHRQLPSTQLQRAPQRYYQRPDAAHVTLDPTRPASAASRAASTSIGTAVCGA